MCVLVYKLSCYTNVNSRYVRWSEWNCSHTEDQEGADRSIRSVTMEGERCFCLKPSPTHPPGHPQHNDTSTLPPQDRDKTRPTTPKRWHIHPATPITGTGSGLVGIFRFRWAYKKKAAVNFLLLTVFSRVFKKVVKIIPGVSFSKTTGPIGRIFLFLPNSITWNFEQCSTAREEFTDHIESDSGTSNSGIARVNATQI